MLTCRTVSGWDLAADNEVSRYLWRSDCSLAGRCGVVFFVREQASGRAKERVCAMAKYQVTENVCCCGSGEGDEMNGRTERRMKRSVMERNEGWLVKHF